MIHIEDNFFKDPFFVRNLALKSRYISKQIHNYPGYRCFDIPDAVNKNVLDNIRLICRDSSLKNSGDGISFQYITKTFGEGMFHFDNEPYICIIYLSLDSPVNSGTDVCDYGYDQKINLPDIDVKLKRSFFEDPHNLIKRYKYGMMRKRLNSYFKPTVRVSNKFNRGLIFPGTHFHRAQNFFGTSVKDARLTLVGFFE